MKLEIDRSRCYYPGCKRRAEQWHHVWPRCITKQRSSDLRGAVPICRKHHSLVTSESTLIKSGPVCWEATAKGQRNLPALVRLYKAGRTLAQIGKRFGISGQTVRTVLARQGITTRVRGEAQRRFTPDVDASICDEYEAGARTSALARKYECRMHNIWASVKRAGGTPRLTGGTPHRFTEAECLQIRKAYESGHSSVVLAEKHKCSQGTIAKAIRRAGGKLRARSGK